MREKPDPSINIVVNAGGVKLVQFCGEGWQDEEAVSRMYELIKPAIREIDRLLKAGWQEPERVQ